MALCRKKTCYSLLHSATSGIPQPQGTILVSFLLVIYINDLPININIEVSMCALNDDIKLLRIITTPNKHTYTSSD